jgi:hypothetical protein
LSPFTRTIGLHVNHTPFENDSTTSPNKNKGRSKPNYTFEELLTNKDVALFLKTKYANNGPKQYAAMLFALRDLGLLNRDFMQYQTVYHSALTNFFGYVGARNTLCDNIAKFGRASDKEEALIHRLKTEIIKEVNKNMKSNSDYTD